MQAARTPRCGTEAVVIRVARRLPTGFGCILPRSTTQLSARRPRRPSSASEYFNSLSNKFAKTALERSTAERRAVVRIQSSLSKPVGAFVAVNYDNTWQVGVEGGPRSLIQPRSKRGGDL